LTVRSRGGRADKRAKDMKKEGWKIETDIDEVWKRCSVFVMCAYWGVTNAVLALLDSMRKW
jgi:hypothetical protein